ncbi:MAG: VOC family protein [Myxococcales bacterium]|nr:VOC family protein [Myxococcales bacterium]
MSEPILTPRLVVAGTDDAIAFYRKSLGAELLERHFDEGLGLVVHAALSIGEAVFALTEQSPASHNHAPGSLGGTPVIMQLMVDDPDAVAAAMVAVGAEVIFEIADRFYGRRDGRLRDPFGHVWILFKTLDS